MVVKNSANCNENLKGKIFQKRQKKHKLVEKVLCHMLRKSCYLTFTWHLQQFDVCTFANDPTHVITTFLIGDITNWYLNMMFWIVHVESIVYSIVSMIKRMINLTIILYV